MTPDRGDEGVEQLTLPQDAGKLWRPLGIAVIETLERYKCTPRLGGGTVLTARFGHHRRSFDIDIKTSTKETHRLLRSSEDPDIRTLIERVGGRSTSDGTAHGAIWQIELPQLGVGMRMPRVQVWSSTPEPEQSETWGMVDGVRTKLQSNAQILYGKLKRAGRLAPRDILDMKTAGQMDPAGLGIAVNAFGESQLTKATGGWRNEPTLVTNRALVQIEGVPKDERSSWETLAADAADACEGALYSRVIMKVGDERATFEYLTRNGGSGKHTVRLAQASDDLERTGLRRWLETQGHEPDEVMGWRPGRDATGPSRLYLGPLRPPGSGTASGIETEPVIDDRPSAKNHLTLLDTVEGTTPARQGQTR